MSNLAREERYIVIKRKHLGRDEHHVRQLLLALGVSPIECVVIERDWPEYEPVWGLLESRVAVERVDV